MAKVHCNIMIVIGFILAKVHCTIMIVIAGFILAKVHSKNYTIVLLLMWQHQKLLAFGPFSQWWVADAGTAMHADMCTLATIMHKSKSS